jgi:hypothetical protein
MDASGVALAVMSVVVVLCLAFWLTAVMVAARRPGFSRVRPEKMPTGVRGGRHLATGGRSVGPTRTASVMVAGSLTAAAAAAARRPAAVGDLEPADGAGARGGVSAWDGVGGVPRPRTDLTPAAEPVTADGNPAEVPGPRVEPVTADGSPAETPGPRMEPVTADGNPAEVPGPRVDQDQQVLRD